MATVRSDLEFELDGVAAAPSTGVADLGAALARVKGAGEVPLCVLVADNVAVGDHVLKLRVKPSAGSKYVMVAQVAWW
jgi:hypothetical protein